MECCLAHEQRLSEVLVSAIFTADDALSRRTMRSVTLTGARQHGVEAVGRFVKTLDTVRLQQVIRPVDR